MSKRFFLILTALTALLILFAACGGGQDAPPAPAPPAGGQAAPAPAPTPAEPGAFIGDPRWAEPIEIVYFVDWDPTTANAHADNNSYMIHLREHFNVTIRRIQIVDHQENLALMLAARTFPDIISPRTTIMLQNYIEAGALHELGALFEAYAPNIMERNSQFHPILRSFSGDGGLWVYNTFQPSFTNGFSSPWLEWIVRSDILEQQGWPNIRDENDLFNVLAQGLIDNPETGGLPTLAFSQPLAAWGTNGLLCATYQYALGRNNHMFHNRGMLYDTAVGRFIDVTTEHSYRNGLEFLNRLWRNDMYFRDAVTMDFDRFDELMSEGRILSSFFYVWSMRDWNERLALAGAPFRYVPVPFMLTSQHAAGDSKIYFIPSPEMWSANAITQNAQDLDRIIAIMDWQATDEGMILAGWGAEGVNWELNADGWRVPTAHHLEMLALPDTPEREQFIHNYGGSNVFGFYQGLDSNGQNFAMTGCALFATMGLDPIVLNYLNQHGWNSFQEMYENNPNFNYEISAIIGFKQAAPSWGEQFDDAWVRIDDITHAHTMQLITAPSDAEFDRIFNQMQEQRNAQGLPQMLELWNAEYADLVRRFGG